MGLTRGKRAGRGWVLAAVIAATASLVCSAGRLRAEETAPPSASADDSAASSAGKKDIYRKSRLTRDEEEMKADKRLLILSAGEDKPIDVDFDMENPAKEIQVGNPKVVLPQLVKIGDKRQIIFKPLTAGHTTVTVRDKDGNIRVIFSVRVTDYPLLKLKADLMDLLKDVEGIDIKIVGQHVVIDGEVLVPTDYGRVLQVLDKDTGIGGDKDKEKVLNLVTLSPLALQVMAKRIEDDIHQFAPNVHVRTVNGMIFLEGSVDNGELAGRAVKVANLYVPENAPGSPLLKDPSVRTIQNRRFVQNFIVVNTPPPKRKDKLVRVTVHFVELSKDYNKIFGFKWQPGFTSNPSIQVGNQANGGVGGSGFSFTATISSLFPVLASAQQAGFARILRSGTVIVRSGQRANLKASETVLNVVQGPSGPQSTPTTVGLTLAVTPAILGQSDDIQMELNLEQTTVGRQPGSVNDHAVHTFLYVKSGESAAVAGETASDVGTDFNKDDPNAGSFGGQTVPLFTLLRSKGYRKRKLQFVIFVTPQIIDNASDGTEDLKKNFRVSTK